MASPDQQIPVSAGFQAIQSKASENGKERGESIQNHQEEGAQEANTVKSIFCSQGDQDTIQSQAHVPPTEKSAELEAQADIDHGESIEKDKDKDAQVKTVVESSLCPQVDQAVSQSQAQVPQDEKSSKPKDQEDKEEMESNSLAQGNAPVSPALRVESQNSNPPQKVSAPPPQAQVSQVEENRAPETPPNPCGTLQNSPVVVAQATKATTPSCPPRLTVNPPHEPQAHVLGAGKGKATTPADAGVPQTAPVKGKGANLTRSNTPPALPDVASAATPSKKKSKQDQRLERTPLSRLEEQELAETRHVDDHERAFDKLATILCGVCKGCSICAQSTSR
jgi:hypothetical protein